MKRQLTTFLGLLVALTMLAQPVNRLEKGAYIVGGKKTVVR